MRDVAPPHSPDERPTVCGTATALPAHRYAQRELAEVAAQLLPELGPPAKQIERFFRRVGVEQRHLALAAPAYAALSGLKRRHDAWIDAALPLGARVISHALDDAEIEPGEIGALFTATSTGMAVPSLDARLMNRIPFRSSLKRVPLFGLGCLAGVAGVARAADYLHAFPGEAVVLLAVELCSLTLQREDASLANLISTGLFGDGAAALVLAGARHPRAMRPGPRVMDSLSRFFPKTERAMGWDVVDSGFKVVLSREVPAIAREGLPGLVHELLARNDLTRADIDFWVAHPGGPAVLRAISEGLGLPPEALQHSRASLAKIGDLSSASVLFLLDEFRRHVRPARYSYGVLLAIGPGFSAEAVLLQW